MAGSEEKIATASLGVLKCSCAEHMRVVDETVACRRA